MWEASRKHFKAEKATLVGGIDVGKDDVYLEFDQGDRASMLIAMNRSSVNRKFLALSQHVEPRRTST
jgi:hypothetical protein